MILFDELFVGGYLCQYKLISDLHFMVAYDEKNDSTA